MIGFKEFLNEATISLDELESLMEKHSIAIISAARGGADCGEGEKYYKADNKARGRDIKKQLKAKGYQVIAGGGMWDGGAEESFIVIDTKDSNSFEMTMVNMGKYFDQDAVLIKLKGKGAFLISTNACPEAFPGFGAIGRKEQLGKYKRGKSEFYTKLGSEYFHFEQ